MDGHLGRRGGRPLDPPDRPDRGALYRRSAPDPRRPVAIQLWRLSRSPPLPASLLGHARTLLVGASGGAALESASVIPFAYEPSPQSCTGLRTLLGATLGAGVGINMQTPVSYGEEDEFHRQLAKGRIESDAWVVLLMTVASTPEVENHGMIIAAVRDMCASRPGASPLLVVIDTGPYAARMQGGPEFEQRLRERNRLWSQFVAGYGLRACIVDLARIVPGAPSESEARDQARAALWSGGIVSMGAVTPDKVFAP